MEKRASNESANRKRHVAQCAICKHPNLSEIEEDYLRWRVGPLQIVANYKGAFGRTSLYRHIHEFELDKKRLRNIRDGFARIAENYRPSADGHSDGYLYLQALQSMAKTNAQGQLVERSEVLNVAEVVNRMTAEELQAYIETRVFPKWAQGALPKDEEQAKIPNGRRVM
jgi:hypothetical protein